ncbi:Protein PER1 [Choanephora cucurbitarum]|uniref:Post-GPI attachment to proteins factor 3 n=1 Tax=Choanephora cucurbitarum TaxID=101091 RepID=A0A1C7NJ56_9FUNG|nr:Protein PER1 [Choanephora cucurbitarum]
MKIQGPENCRYECMQKITDYSIQHHKTIYQYFGKWPFYRAFGIQEPASVLFSIGNGLVQAYAFMQLWRHVPSTYFLRPWMLLYTIIGTLQVLVWIGWYAQQKADPDAVNRSYAHLAVISGVGVSLALCLELFDFPPLWRVFDAHSLWHLSTIPLTAIWYQFLLEDMRFETGLQHHPIPSIP